MKRSTSEVKDLDLTISADVVLLDIEGTTTSIKFVKDTLFPYVVEEVERHLTETWDTDETRGDVTAIRRQLVVDAEEGNEDAAAPEQDGPFPTTTASVTATTGSDITTTDSNRPGAASSASSDEGDDKVSSVTEIAETVKAMVAADRKIRCLKQLQGHMWRKGYAEGKLKGHVYGDVPPALQRWREAGARLMVYSSGSVEAQRLLFGHSDHGDMEHFFCGNFDTKIGQKREKESYEKIVKEIDTDAGSVLFVTDVCAEARAAAAAGLQVLLADRPGNVSGLQEGESYTTVTTFSGVTIQTVKRAR